MEDLDVRWIIESDVLDYTENLLKYLKDKEIYYKEINYQDIISFNYKDKYGGLVDSEVATIFIGSLRGAREISKYPISPGAICTLKNFDCTTYYPSWSPYLLNDDWTVTMRSILQRNSNNESYFFRPNEGDKRFDGGIYSSEQLLKENLSYTQLIIQASEKCIEDEYRFLVVDKEVITATRYLSYGEGGISIAQLYLENILKDSSLLIPDRAFTVDIGFNTDIGKLGVIELNSFSCANLYSMDIDKVVPAINNLVKQMYREENND